MSLDQFIQSARPLIDAELKKTVNTIDGTSYEGLHAMLAYHMGWEGEDAGEKAQGKRIRPLLVLLGTSAAGKDWHLALSAAAAVELIHNFSLIHDDIEDRSEYRHGRKTVWAKWGEPQAINGGDCMFALAFQAIHHANANSDCVLGAADLLQQTCVRLTKGQFLDMAYENRDDLPLEEYWNMVGGKTASLLSCSSCIGAVLTGVEEKKIESLRSFGWNLGLAFQAQDDWLGIWGDSALTGKSTESDLISGKKTLPVILGLDASETFKKRWKNRPFKMDEVQELADILKNAGVQEMVEDQTKQYTDKAKSALDNAGLEEEAVRNLLDLTQKLLNRKK